jgi:hypothetical protein
MPYSESVRENVAKAPKTLGNQLGRYAIHLDLPVTFIAQATGATRQTVYNWFNGGEVLLPYRAAVSTLLKILQTSPNVEEARRKICTAFNLPA